MKTHSDNWSLFRLSDRKQFDNISHETIEFFYLAHTEKTRIEWLMWREGFTGWRPFGELSQILTHLQNESFDVAPSPPPVPAEVLKFAEEVTGVRNMPDNETANTVSNRVIEAATASLRLSSNRQRANSGGRDVGKVLSLEDEATLSLMLESQASTDDRDNVRYPKVFKVRIFTPKGVIAAETIDCSTAGFRLKEPLPSGLPRFFHVELDLGPDGKIPLVCSEVREKDGRKASRVRIQVNDHMNTLKSVLFRAA